MGFDNIGMAATNIFEMFTMDEWSITMYTVRHATGSYIYDCFFIFTVMVGGYLVVNLVVGIQFNYFEVVRNQQRYANEHKKYISEREEILDAN